MRALIIVALLCAGVPSASAQQRFTVSAGGSWHDDYPIGTTMATLRTNEPGTTTPSPFTLFAVDSSIERAFGANARFGVALTRAFAVEVGAAYSNPVLAARISEDMEGEAITLSEQRIAQVIVDGSLLWTLPWLNRGSRLTPYAMGGAGYLRQIDDDRTQVETGTVGHVGGGLRYWLRGDRTTTRAFGVRAEARLQMRWNGFDFEEKTRLTPAFHVLGTFGF